MLSQAPKLLFRIISTATNFVKHVLELQHTIVRLASNRPILFKPLTTVRRTANWPIKSTTRRMATHAKTVKQVASPVLDLLMSTVQVALIIIIVIQTGLAIWTASQELIRNQGLLTALLATQRVRCAAGLVAMTVPNARRVYSSIWITHAFQNARWDLMLRIQLNVQLVIQAVRNAQGHSLLNV